jgi:hypothetical protein
MFMHPTVQQADYFMVETEQGTDYVPADVVRLPFDVNFKARGCFDEDSPEFPALVDALQPYVTGSDISEVSPRSGWLARYSAPGYLDCTDWSAHDSEREAWEDLIRTHGTDEPGDVTFRILPADWASALINADETGLSDRESEELAEWVASEPELDTGCVLGCIGEPEFTRHSDIGGYAGDALLFLFRIIDTDKT